MNTKLITLAVTLLFGSTLNAQAGLFDKLFKKDHGCKDDSCVVDTRTEEGCADDGCTDGGCTESCPPIEETVIKEGCPTDSGKPQIVMPDERQRFNYQRQLAHDPNCDDGCTDGCVIDPGCDEPCGPVCDEGCIDDGCTENCDVACTPACVPSFPTPCNTPVGCVDPCDDYDCYDSCTSCVTDPCAKFDPRKLAELIYLSQTACYAKDRQKAIREIGRKYNCVCNPEIIPALLHALNDSDERVRREAADKIGHLARNYECCKLKVVNGLKCALADCDRGVRHEAKSALEACGYDVVKPGAVECADEKKYHFEYSYPVRKMFGLK